LMNAGPVEVIRAGGNDTDAYGRDLRVVTVGGKPVADQLIAEGLARRWGDGPRGWCD
jgi:endonuclease YncB( thermonuclease family)